METHLRFIIDGPYIYKYGYELFIAQILPEESRGILNWYNFVGLKLIIEYIRIERNNRVVRIR